MMAQTLDFSQIKKKCADLETSKSELNKTIDKYVKMHLMQYDNPDADKVDEVVTSPDARIATKGALNLMTATEPQFSVPYAENDEAARKASEKLEKFIKALWFSVGRARQTPVEYDGQESAIVMGEICASVQRTADVLEASGGEASNPRLAYAAKRCPIMIDIYDPRTCFTERDRYGVVSFARKVKTTSGELLSVYGAKAEALGYTWDKVTEEVTLWEYWDWSLHYVWVEGKDTPLVEGEHGLSVLPIVSAVVGGAGFFSKLEERQQGFLYTYAKSGLWEFKNLSLTVVAQNIKNLGLSAQWKHRMEGSNDDVHIDGSMSGGIVHYQGELGPLEKNLIDPGLREFLAMSDAMTSDATIYKQALGAPLNRSNASYSETALLAQAGQLPLIVIQKMSEVAYSKMIEIALELLREGGTQKVQGRSEVMALKPADIPEGVIVNCRVDINLPQDERMNVQNATAVVRDGLASKRWAREKFLNVGQSQDMDDEIWTERMDEATAAAEFQQEQMRLQQQAQGGMPGADPMAAQGGQMPPMDGLPPQMPMNAPQGMGGDMGGMEAMMGGMGGV